MRSRELHQVPADQEELGKTGLLDHVQLVGQLAHDRRRERVVPATGAFPAQPGQVAERCLALRHVEPGKAVALEGEIYAARGRDLGRCRDPLAPGPRQDGIGPRRRRLTGRQHHEVCPGLEIGLSVRAAKVAKLGQGASVADRGQDVVQLPALGVGVVDIVGDDHRQPELGGQVRRLRDEPVVVGQQVMGELDHQAARDGRVPAHDERPRAPEQLCVPLRDRSRAFAVSGPEPSGQLAVAAAGERDQPLRVVSQEGMRERGDGLRAGEVRAGHQPAQAPPARRIPREQHEMRATLIRSDAPVILLPDRPMPREACPLGPWPNGPAIRHPSIRERGRWPPPRSPCPPGRNDDPRWVRDGRIQQLDLYPDDRVKPRRLGRGREPDGPIQALAVGDGKPRQAHLHGAIHEVVRRRRPVQEREMAMTMQLGVGGMSHATVLRGRRPMIEHLFYLYSPRHAARRTQSDARDFDRSRAQPKGPIARLMPVTANPAPRPARRVALELVLRALAIALVTLLILGLLPAIAEAAR